MKNLEAAAEWGAPPWELFGGDKALWWVRWDANRSAKIKIANEREMERRRQATTNQNRKRR